MDVRDILALSPVVPVMVVHDLGSIADAAMALFAGGIRAFEITLRTPQALQAIRVLRLALPDEAISVEVLPTILLSGEKRESSSLTLP